MRGLERQRVRPGKGSWFPWQLRPKHIGRPFAIFALEHPLLGLPIRESLAKHPSAAFQKLDLELADF
jgi:hypothetical protein